MNGDPLIEHLVGGRWWVARTRRDDLRAVDLGRADRFAVEQHYDHDTRLARTSAEQERVLRTDTRKVWEVTARLLGCEGPTDSITLASFDTAAVAEQFLRRLLAALTAKDAR